MEMSSDNSIGDIINLYLNLLDGVPPLPDSGSHCTKAALESLKRLRLADVLPDDPEVVVSPVTPEQVPARISLAIEEISEDLTLLARILKEELPRPTAPIDTVDVITGANLVLMKLGGLVTGAKASIDSISAKTPSENELQSSSFTDIAAMKRGIRCRTITPIESRLLEYVREYVRRTEGLGAEHRASAVTPFRMVVVDNSQAMVIWRDGEDIRAIFVQEPHLVFPLSTLFELIWKDAQPILDNYNYVVPITDTEQIVILLLADGYSNQYIATKLQKDVRTIRRIIDRLMQKADVANQLQLGIEAINLGWL